VLSLAGRFEPATFAAHVDVVGRWYNSAALLCERNNHGHAVLLWLGDNSKLLLLCGNDGKPGVEHHQHEQGPALRRGGRGRARLRGGHPGAGYVLATGQY
jgi:hypothetical protein